MIEKASSGSLFLDLIVKFYILQQLKTTKLCGDMRTMTKMTFTNGSGDIWRRKRPKTKHLQFELICLAKQI